MREQVKANYTETVWNIRDTNIETGHEVEWNIHQRQVEYEYEAPAGDALPSPEYARKALPSMQEIGISQVVSSPATLQQPRRALRK